MAQLKRTMTQAQFNRAVAEILTARVAEAKREAERVASYQRGDYRFTKVWVKQHYVPRHDVTGHWRLVASKRPQRIARSPKLRALRGGAS